MERAPELREIIMGWFDSVARGDGTWVDRYVSSDSGARLIGTDPAEWLSGPACADFLRNEAGALGGQVTVSYGEVEAYAEGTVGWGVARPTIALPGGVSFSPRWSVIFHREDGQWKAVQIHASVGVPNTEVIDT